MKYYMAPMEGITGFVFRNAYHEFFTPMDKYFTPFVSPTRNGCFTPRERRDVLPENNRAGYLVPQILCNQADLFCKTAHELAEYGYREINLNLGCPSGTVVSKKKGAGFLSVPHQLDCFLEQIFEKAEAEISIKTRLGMREPEEFEELLEIFEKYPLKELIIHARVREEYYSGRPHADVFRKVLEKSSLPLCYNGDIFRAEEALACRDCMGQCAADGASEGAVEEAANGTANDAADGAVMLGRGVLRNPYLVEECRAAEAGKPARERDMGRILEFSSRLMKDYSDIMGEHNAMFRMKELWFYLAELAADVEKAKKIVKKADTIAALHGGMKALLETGVMQEYKKN